MKRAKLVVSIFVLCVCICTLTFGVLAAISKTNSIKGEIGFTAADCSVSVSGSLSGAVNSSGAQLTNTFSKQKITNNLQWTINDQICFNEANYPTIPSIVFTFVVYNETTGSAIRATANNGVAMPNSSITKITWSTNNGQIIEPASSATITCKIDLLNITDDLTVASGKLINFVFSTVSEKASKLLSGPIDFTATNVNANASGSISGAIDSLLISNSQKLTEAKVVSGFRWNMNDAYFNQTTTSVPNIVFTIKVVNKDTKAITATAVLASSLTSNTNITSAITSGSGTSIAAGQTGTIVITISLKSTSLTGTWSTNGAQLFAINIV